MLQTSKTVSHSGQKRNRSDKEIKQSGLTHFDIDKLIDGGDTAEALKPIMAMYLAQNAVEQVVRKSEMVKTAVKHHIQTPTYAAMSLSSLIPFQASYPIQLRAVSKTSLDPFIFRSVI